MSQPNIILILADDLGYSDIGCFGSEIATPNLDRLAANGARFSQMYSFARCCPSRAALLTGLHPHQAGVGHMMDNRGTREYQGYLRDDAVTIAELLKGAGYTTLMSGKWHVGGFLPAREPERWRPGAPGVSDAAGPRFRSLLWHVGGRRQLLPSSCVDGRRRIHQ